MFIFIFIQQFSISTPVSTLSPNITKLLMVRLKRDIFQPIGFVVKVDYVHVK